MILMKESFVYSLGFTLKLEGFSDDLSFVSLSVFMQSVN